MLHGIFFWRVFSSHEQWETKGKLSIAYPDQHLSSRLTMRFLTKPLVIWLKAIWLKLIPPDPKELISNTAGCFHVTWKGSFCAAWDSDPTDLLFCSSHLCMENPWQLVVQIFNVSEKSFITGLWHLFLQPCSNKHMAPKLLITLLLEKNIRKGLHKERNTYGVIFICIWF